MANGRSGSTVLALPNGKRFRLEFKLSKNYEASSVLDAEGKIFATGSSSTQAMLLQAGLGKNRKLERRK